MIKIRLWPLIAKDVLKMVGAKWATIFPLSITGAIAFTNGDPMVPAYRLSLLRIRLFEPRNNERRFRLKLAVRDIVVWQRAVEGIQLGNKRHGDVISPRARVGIIVSTVIRGPIKVPATPVIGDGIIASSLFSNPKDGRYDVRFPRVTLDCRAGTGGDENLRFHFEQCLLPQFHRILGKVCRGRVGRSRLFVPEDFRGASNSQTETSRKKSPHHKRRHLVSDSPLLGKPNLPMQWSRRSFKSRISRSDEHGFTGFQRAFATPSYALQLRRSPSEFALPARSTAP